MVFPVITSNNMIHIWGWTVENLYFANSIGKFIVPIVRFFMINLEYQLDELLQWHVRTPSDKYDKTEP